MIDFDLGNVLNFEADVADDANVDTHDDVEPRLHLLQAVSPSDI